MGEMRSIYEILIRTPERKRPLGGVWIYVGG
jgi:hypothetical protein